MFVLSVVLGCCYYCIVELRADASGKWDRMISTRTLDFMS